MAVDRPGEPARPGRADELTRSDLFSAWLSWFERLSRCDGDPVVWIVDDAHHADDGLLDFVEHLSTVAQAPILVVLIARPELLTRRPTLAALRRANVISLERLSRSDIADLIDSLVEGLPADVRDALVERADGNPLFAIETVRAMHDQGLAVGGPTRLPGALRLATGVDTDTLNALAAPASLQVLIASRLDLLSGPERSVLAAASVLGHTFTLGALEATCREGNLETVLRELVARDLLSTVTDRLSAEEGKYTFVQVGRAYGRLPDAVTPRPAHRPPGGRRVPRAPCRADSETTTVIAQHLRDAMDLVGAEDPQRTDLAGQLGRWLERSAERSQRVGAPTDAFRALAEAIELSRDPADVARLRIAAAEAATAAGALRRSVRVRQTHS